VTVAGKTEAKPPRVPVSRSLRWTLIGFLVLLVVVGAGNLLSGYMQNRHYEQQFTQQQDRFEQQFSQQQAQQKAQGKLVEQRLCATFTSLGAIKPPGGSTAGNPSRAYEQALSAKLTELGSDIGCGK
jgi:hypothetical protein